MIQPGAAPFVSGSMPHVRESFLVRCRSKNLALGTIAWYKQILKSLTGHLESRQVVEASQISVEHLRDYLGARHGAGLSSETVHREWGALKCFFGFLAAEGLIQSDPMSRVECPRRERHLIQPMDMSQVRRLLEQPNLELAKGLEDRAIMLLMADSGLRLSEVLGLELRHLNWTDSVITVLGKGRKERSVPIGHNTGLALERHLQARGPGGRLVFVGRDSKRHTPKCIQNRISGYGRRAEISGVRVSPHTLRHSFAIQYIRNGGDIFSLQKILGHSTLDMVRNYVNLASRDVSIQHRKFSPMDRLLGDAGAAQPT